MVGDQVQQGFQMRELDDSLNDMQFEMDDALDLTDPADDPTTRLRKLKALLDEGLISEQEFQAKRAAILDAM